MKKSFWVILSFLFLVFLVIFSTALKEDARKEAEGRCFGGESCKVCSDCSNCEHCKENRTCGACKTKF